MGWLQIRVDFNRLSESLTLISGIDILSLWSLSLTQAACLSRLRHGLLIQLQVLVSLLNAFALQYFLALNIRHAFLFILHLLQLLFNISQIAWIHWISSSSLLSRDSSDLHYLGFSYIWVGEHWFSCASHAFIWTLLVLECDGFFVGVSRGNIWVLSCETAEVYSLVVLQHWTLLLTVPREERRDHVLTVFLLLLAIIFQFFFSCIGWGTDLFIQVLFVKFELIKEV